MDESQELEVKSNGELDASLEGELRAGLRSLSAPEGFADRVLGRVLSGSQATDQQDLFAVPPQRLQPRSALPFSIPRLNIRLALRSGIAAVVLLAIALGGYWGHRREQRIAGEHARQQVLLALRITGVTLRAVRSRVDNEHSN